MRIAIDDIPIQWQREEEKKKKKKEDQYDSKFQDAEEEEEEEEERRREKTWIRKEPDVDGYFLLQLLKGIGNADMFLTADDGSSLTIARK